MIASRKWIKNEKIYIYLAVFRICINIQELAYIKYKWKDTIVIKKSEKIQ